MPFGLSVRLRGAKRVQRLLAKVPKRLQRRTMQKALSAGGGVVKTATQTRAPKQTGLMRRVLKVLRVRVRFHKGYIAYRVAPRSVKKPIARTKTGKLRVATRKRLQEVEAAGGRVRYRDPSKYAHLVELGHKLKRGGRVYGAVRGRHFMRRSFQASKRQAMRAIIRKVKQGITRAAR